MSMNNLKFRNYWMLTCDYVDILKLFKNLRGLIK